MGLESGLDSQPVSGDVAGAWSRKYKFVEVCVSLENDEEFLMIHILSDTIADRDRTLKIDATIARILPSI